MLKGMKRSIHRASFIAKQTFSNYHNDSNEGLVLVSPQNTMHKIAKIALLCKPKT